MQTTLKREFQNYNPYKGTCYYFLFFSVFLLFGSRYFPLSNSVMSKVKYFFPNHQYILYLVSNEKYVIDRVEVI